MSSAARTRWLSFLMALSSFNVAAAEGGTCHPTRSVVDGISLGESKTIHDWTGGRDGQTVFRLLLDDDTRVRAFTTGASSMDVELYSGNNEDLLALDSIPHERNARIDAGLRRGTYCIRVQTIDGGTYGIHVVADTGDFDRDRNTVLRAQQVSLRLNQRKRVAGMIDGTGDVDYFRIKVSEAALLSIRSDGDVNVMGRLLVSHASGWDWVTSDRDSATRYNFALEAAADPDAIYYLAVTREEGELGPYRLVMSLEAEGAQGDPMAYATRVVVGSVYGGRIESADDQDYYAIEGIEGVTEGLRILSLGSTDVKAALLRADGSVAAEDDDGGDDLNFDIRAEVSSLQYVRVESAGDPTGDYELVVSRQPVPNDEGESIADAVALGINAPVEAFFGDRARDRKDVFRIEGLQRVRIETEGSLDVAAALTTPEGLIVAADDDSGTARNFRIRPDLRGGTYYLRVITLAAKAGGVYRVSVSSDGTEPPNDDRDLALAELAPVALGSRLAGTIEPAGDVDYYRVYAEAPVLIQVYTEGEADTVGELLRGGVAVKNPDYGGDPFEMIWAPLAYDDDGGHQSNFLITQQLEEGDYFIRVRGFGDETGDYILEVNRLEDDHGGAPQSATLVSADMSSVAGVISSASDIDYFWIPTGADENLRRLVVTTTGELDTLGTAEDESGTPLSEDDDGGEDVNFRLEQELVGRGVYVRVESYGGRSGNYVLHVHRIEGGDE